MRSKRPRDVWGSFRAGEAEPLSESEATKPGKPGKKKKADGKKARESLRRTLQVIQRSHMRLL